MSPKCLAIAQDASIVQPTLKYIMVGRVLTVDVRIKAMLDARAKR